MFFGMMAAVVLAASCYSSSYRREMRTSVSLLTALADKLEDYCRSGFEIDGNPISSEEMGEFYYGLKKAQAFEEMTRDKQSHPSRAAFVRLVDAYEIFVRDADRYRLSQARKPEDLQRLMREHDAVRERTRSVTEALVAERRRLSAVTSGDSSAEPAPPADR